MIEKRQTETVMLFWLWFLLLRLLQHQLTQLANGLIKLSASNQTSHKLAIEDASATHFFPSRSLPFCGPSSMCDTGGGGGVTAVLPGTSQSVGSLGLSGCPSLLLCVGALNCQSTKRQLLLFFCFNQWS